MMATSGRTSSSSCVVVSNGTLEKVVGPRYAGPSAYLSTAGQDYPFRVSGADCRGRAAYGCAVQRGKVQKYLMREASVAELGLQSAAAVPTA
jgi:hypothetical protein